MSGIATRKEEISSSANFSGQEQPPQQSGNPYFSWVWDGTKWNQKFNSNGSRQMGAPSPGPAPTQPGTTVGEEVGGEGRLGQPQQKRPTNPIKRDVGTEKHVIDIFKQKYKKSPQTQQDWTAILRMSYPDQLPSEFNKYLNQ